MAYRKYISTVVQLAEELKLISNDYNDRKINDKEFEKSVFFYATENPELLFSSNNELNTSIQRIIGKRRAQVILKILNNSNAINQ